MVSLAVSIVIVIVLALLFGGLAVRARRAHCRTVKWPGTILAALLAGLCVFIAGAAVLGAFRLNLPGADPAPSVQVDPSPAQLARGERLAYLCVNCHSTRGKLPLDGGAENILGDSGSPPVGTLYPPNLTPGGPLRDWSDGEIIRAIRRGVHKNGRALLVMPSQNYRHLSDADVAALVAYLRAQPAVRHQTPATALNLLGAVAVGVGVFPTSAQRATTAPVEAPPAGPTAAYGHYLVEISGCQECHGDDLRGGDPGGFVPAGPDLPAILSDWSAAEFAETMRTGVDPNGSSLDPETMPWPEFAAAYSDEELTAIYEYIRGLTPTAGATR